MADAGIDLHLVKPVEPAALIRLLAWVRENLAMRGAPAGTPVMVSAEASS